MFLVEKLSIWWLLLICSVANSKKVAGVKTNHLLQAPAYEGKPHLLSLLLCILLALTKYIP